ncbi:MAG: glutamine-hydrolyzing GMP synthase [Chloroflexi bacterium]|nr:glutamine-hydrolyzing GMP synthase [Chloroflexota bacterium]
MQAIVILDFGAQYSQLIARRLRALHVYCELLPFDAPQAEIEKLSPRALILSGGPNSVYDPGAPALPAYVLASGLPVLGICYGMQLIAQALHGVVHRADRREYGPATITVGGPSALFHGVPPALNVWMSHGDSVERLPDGFATLAQSPNTPFAAIGDAARRIYGVQFHPEVTHTEHGLDILRNFVYDVCGVSPNWVPANIIEESIAQVRAQTGPQGRVLCALSGGVDSAVTATLIGRAIGERLTCFFVDHGLLRQNEGDEAMALFTEHLDLNVVRVNAGERFLSKLAGVSDPERKRKIIGEEFIRVFEEEAKALGPFEFLAQGTLYPDVIESAGQGKKDAARIKSHHNVGGLPARMDFTLVEPLKRLFKDEVRAIGRTLGLPERWVNRQPFPGPGLAVRIIGPVTREATETLQAADAIVRQEIDAVPDVQRRLWQYFAVLTPVQTVGVMGDGRTYANLVAVRAVASEDGMTANWAHLPHDLLARISARIVNEVPGVNRVVYDISSKPPATIEWE